VKFGARGRDAVKTRSGFDVDQLLDLPDDEKIAMCLELLEQFNASNVKIVGDEIIHSCCLPFGLHTNGDRIPSAQLNWKKLVFNCWGCGMSGGLLWFIATCRGEDSTGVVSWLSQKREQSDSKSLENFAAYIDKVYSPDNKVAPPPIPRFNDAVLNPWRMIHPYLTEIRHIPEANIIKHNVGFNPDLNRIVLPHFWKDNLVGWQTRRLVDDGGPKYKNTPDFPKDRTLYNKPPIKDRLLVVEGVLSVVSKSHLAPNMCSTFGASVTDRQKLLISDHHQVDLWFDNDNAGWKATRDVGDFLSKYCDVFVIENDLAADPADMDDETFQEMLQCRTPFAMWDAPTSLRELKK
jgi:hypothetical protein